MTLPLPKAKFHRLPNIMFRSESPANFPGPELIALNKDLLSELSQVKAATKDEILGLCSGQAGFEQSLTTAYAGHQFGHFNPQLGDGRAHLLGEVAHDSGVNWELQLKGSGQTSFSRRGDGRCALSPALREYLISRYMKAVGVETLQTLAVVTTGETVLRHYPEKGAIVSRVGLSHLRVGTMQYAALQGKDIVQRLINFAARYYEIEASEPREQISVLFEKITARQADLVCSWLAIGFIHGVLNTDNCSILGQTIDYGPCAFMDFYDPAQVYSSIDKQGRYAYHNQKAITQWNLTRLAEAFLVSVEDSEREPLKEDLAATLENYDKVFDARWFERFSAKLGYSQNSEKGQVEKSIHRLLAIMDDERMDFTNTFQDLRLALASSSPDRIPAKLHDWFVDWKELVQKDGGSIIAAQKKMQMVNPTVIPRNHQVEKALKAAEDGDHTVWRQLDKVLTEPFVGDHPKEYQAPPKDNEIVVATFCGT